MCHTWYTPVTGIWGLITNFVKVAYVEAQRRKCTANFRHLLLADSVGTPSVYKSCKFKLCATSRFRDTPHETSVIKHNKMRQREVDVSLLVRGMSHDTSALNDWPVQY